MSVVVKNIGTIESTATGQQNTAGGNRQYGGVATSTSSGTVRVVLRGIEYVWGPNESKTLPNDIGAEAVAADGRLRVADSRDGWASGGGAART